MFLRGVRGQHKNNENKACFGNTTVFFSLSRKKHKIKYLRKHVLCMAELPVNWVFSATYFDVGITVDGGNLYLAPNKGKSHSLNFTWILHLFTHGNIYSRTNWEFHHLKLPAFNWTFPEYLNNWFYSVPFCQYWMFSFWAFWAFLITGRESLPLLQPGVGLLLYLYSEFCILYFNIFKFHISILQYYHSLFSSQEFISQAISRGWSTIVMWPDLQKVHFQMKHQSCFIV